MSRIKGILQQLNENLPGKWKAVRDGFGWRWVNDQGREVRAYAALTGDSDDDFVTVYIDNNGVRVGSHGFITASR